MTAGGDGFDERPTPPSRRRFPWPIAAAVVLVLAFVVAVVAYESNRGSDFEDDDVITARSTTTLSNTPIPSGSAGSDVPDAGDRSACHGIPQTFPLGPRSCRITTPSDLEPGQRVPAVILLHGFNTPSEDVAGHGRWRDAAAENQFVLVLPEGQGGSWNAGGCCGLARATGIDDVGYLRAVVDQIVELPAVDPSRVYVVGESNGGMMAYRFGCADSTRVAAIVSVAGTPVSGCQPERPIPVMHVHGTADQVVPYEGGQSLISWVMGVQFSSVPAAFEKVATAMGCAADPATTSSPTTEGAVTTEELGQCPDGVRARLVTVDGLGHQWPRGEPYDATSEIIEFLDLAR